MSSNQKSRAPGELWSLQQAAVWIETRAGDPRHPIRRRIAPATARELHQALKAAMITASGCVDGGERRDISPAEWSDYQLKLRYTVFAGHYVMGASGTPNITVLSIRSFPAAALKYHGHRSKVTIPSAGSQGGEPGYHRAITDALLPREQVEQQWPANGRAPLTSDRSTEPDLKSRSGAKTLGIEQAIDQLWPNEIPKGLSAKDRNKAIIDWLRLNGCSGPTSPERAIQRVLKARRSN